MSITFEERCRLLEFLHEANELGLVTEADRAQARSGQEALIAHMYECERRVNAYREAQAATKAMEGRTMKNLLRTEPAVAIDIVKDSLDFSDVRRLLAEIHDRKQRNDLSDSIHNAVNDSIEAAFWLGWEAAKDPASWIFKEGKPQAGLSDADPAYVFWERMGSFELDDAESTNKELNAAVLELITEAPEKAFSLGWAAQSDPEFLIFGSKAK